MQATTQALPRAAVIETPAAPTRPAKLEEQIRAACRVRHYSLSTERVYVSWYKQFVRWAGLKHPATLGGDVLQAWLSHLATDREVSASTQRQALAAVLFLYQQVLGLKLPWMDDIVRAKQPQRLPCVLSQAEFGALVHCSQKAVLQWESPVDHPAHRPMHPAFYELAQLKLGARRG
jgi:site-specific recombinase XerD